MALKVISPESVDRICALVIGKYGLGKTSLLRTMLGQDYIDGSWQQVEEVADGKKVCVLSAESGLLAVRDLITAGLVEGYEIANLSEFKEAYQMLAVTPAMKERYEWIFIDSLTEISARCDEDMREKYPDRAKTFARWDDYKTAINDMLLRTSTLTAPWTIVEGNDKWFARVKTLRTLVELLSRELEHTPAEPPIKGRDKEQRQSRKN